MHEAQGMEGQLVTWENYNAITKSLEGSSEEGENGIDGGNKI